MNAAAVMNSLATDVLLVTVTTVVSGATNETIIEPTNLDYIFLGLRMCRRREILSHPSFNNTYTHQHLSLIGYLVPV